MESKIIAMMRASKKQARIFVYGSLNDFLPSTHDSEPLILEFELNPGIKDLLEARGIPHSEIFKMTVNGNERPLSYNIQEDDNIEIYPLSEVDVTGIEPVFVSPPGFIVDIHLNKLARYLRLLGLDTRVSWKMDDEQIINQSNREERMILTRDKELLKKRDTRYGYWVRSTDPDEQLREILQRFELQSHIKPFSRCMDCNGQLRPVPFETVKQHIPAKVKEIHSEFYQCRNCKKIYWKGSHYEKLKQKVDQALRRLE